jgi:hypothetical protein
VLKASYIVSLSKFVDWPATALAADTDRFSVCVQGDEVLATVTLALREKQIGGRKVVVSPLSGHPQGKDCHVLYVHGSEIWRTKTILAEIAGRPILTIGDGGLFSRSGGMIELMPENGRVVFEINLAVAQSAGLKLSAQVLQLAKDVHR